MQVEKTNEYYQKLKRFSKANRIAVAFRNANPNHQPMAAIDLDNDGVLLFLKHLETANVKYLLVSDFAVAYHGLFVLPKTLIYGFLKKNRILLVSSKYLLTVVLT
ncbi:hypothetical protein [Chryseosolibacter indicus]|uniref:Uncharacterized protein n=1 Tax=Chryseosolibacter indicus TaxID=2782351 RepID=A0ABS5VS87_9BACT|nr:hypothetical protein [Chryseosolibacter indicus]MBT1704282.1 hypothetical protein [Chryseosolibacter indicus]